LMNAIALNSSMFNGARIIGPAIAGILVASIGEGWCFFANGVSYIAVIVGLLMMRMPHRRIERKGVSALEHIAEGFRYARQTGPIRALLLLLGLVSLVAMPYTVLMPIFAAQILHGNARTLGVLGAATGVGALGGALTLASRTKVHDLGRWVAIARGASGAALIGFGLSRWYILSVIMLVPVGFAMMTQMGACNTLVQAMVPDRLRGRIMAVYAMMFMGMAPLGALLSGEVADHIGAQWTVALGGALTVAGAIVFARHLPKIHVEVGELITAQGLEADDSVQQMAARIIS
jgi:MFS family permease